MRTFLTLAGLLCLVFATLVTAQKPGDEQHQEGEQQLVEGSGEQAEEQEENVFASVQQAAHNANLCINLLRKALSLLLESSANAMESTEELLRSGVYSVNSIASGANAAAKQLGVNLETPAAKKAVEEKQKPAPKKQNSWWW